MIPQTIIPVQGYFNLAHISLSKAESHALLKSLDFTIQTPVDKREFDKGINDIINKIGWQSYFSSSKSNKAPRLYHPSNRNAPPWPGRDKFFQAITEQVHRLIKFPKKASPINIEPLQGLIKKGVVIRKADKGLGTVLLLQKDYEDRLLNHLLLPVYKKVDALNIPYQDIKSKISDCIHMIKNSSMQRREEFFKFLNSSSKKIEVPKFHLIIKVHKKPWAERPIVGSTCWITKDISLVWAEIAQEIILEHSKALKDYNNYPAVMNAIEVARILDRIGKHKYQACQFDVTAMYTNLNLKGLVDIIIRAYIKYKRATNQELTLFRKMLEIILDFNFFKVSIGDETLFYHQIEGIAMGNCASVAIAQLALWELDTSFAIHAPHSIYFRYIDNIMLLWEVEIPRPPITGLKKALLHRTSELKIDFTIEHEWKSNNITFLDLSFNLDPISYWVHEKELNIYDYPLWSSDIPSACKRGIIKGELTRLLRLNSHKEMFTIQKNRMLIRLSLRGYPSIILNNIANNFEWSWANRTAKLTKKVINSTPLLYCLTTFHGQQYTKLKPWFELIGRRYLPLLPAFKYIDIYKKGPTIESIVANSDYRDSLQKAVQPKHSRKRSREEFEDSELVQSLEYLAARRRIE